jgi:hypothetical protein
LCQERPNNLESGFAREYPTEELLEQILVLSLIESVVPIDLNGIEVDVVPSTEHLILIVIESAGDDQKFVNNLRSIV